MDAAADPHRGSRPGAVGAGAGVRGAGRRPTDAPRAPAACGSPTTARASSARTSAPSRAQEGPPAAYRDDPPQPLADLLAVLRATRGGTSRRSRWLEPWAEVLDDDGITHRVWRIDDPEAHRAAAAQLADAELLIADGHHRYETARTYADAIGGDGNHRYTLMALVALEDPGLAVFGYHRLLSNLGEPGPREALRDAILARSVDEVPSSGSTLPASRESASSATSTHTIAAGSGCDSRTPPASRRRCPTPPRPTARSTRRSSRRCFCGTRWDELRGHRGEARNRLHGLRSGRSRSLDEGGHAVFLMRPTPVDQVRAVAAAETMPPKSTYFYPKVPTGIVFNPLS